MHGDQGRRALILGGLFLLSSTGIADSIGGDFDDLMNRPPWASCTYCHGETGNIDDPNVPALAGQSETYLRKQIADFRAGRRVDPSGMMTSALFLLDPEDDARVTNFFAQQAPTRVRLTRYPKTSELNGAGESLFWNGTEATPACAACHVDGKVDAPSLDGLNEAYLTRQLQRFLSGERSNDTGGVMQAVAASMDDELISEVARFIAEPSQ